MNQAYSDPIAIISLILIRKTAYYEWYCISKKSGVRLENSKTFAVDKVKDGLLRKWMSVFLADDGRRPRRNVRVRGKYGR